MKDDFNFFTDQAGGGRCPGCLQFHAPGPWRGCHPDDVSTLLDSLDHGVRVYVETLRMYCVETIQSCDASHSNASYKEPTVEFRGSFSEGFRALAIANYRRWPVNELRRVWSIQDGEPVGPHWAMTFLERRAEDR